MRITPRWMAVFIVTILFGGILLSIALGEWTTKSTVIPSEQSRLLRSKKLSTASCWLAVIQGVSASIKTMLRPAWLSRLIASNSESSNPWRGLASSIG